MDKFFFKTQTMSRDQLAELFDQSNDEYLIAHRAAVDAAHRDALIYGTGMLQSCTAGPSRHIPHEVAFIKGRQLGHTMTHQRYMQQLAVDQMAFPPVAWPDHMLQQLRTAWESRP
jgi:hypothetical protein